MKPLYFSNKILKWYHNEKRDLPWRGISNPYYIWISEVILQQTRINQGIEYYIRFIEKFPDIHSLASANEDDVLKLWQGLGYYSRARNLHFGAKQIVKNFQERFPENFIELKKVKGIGDYTAAAIASIAYNEPVAAVDGNVYRVLSRIFGIETPIDTTNGKKVFTELANELLPFDNPGDFNQAMMEFGALHCAPKQPKCDTCIFKSECVAYSSNTVSLLPAKAKKTKQRDRYFYYIFIDNGNSTYFQKRTNNDIWKNMFDFPLIETATKYEFEELVTTEQWEQLFTNTPLEILSISEERLHILSHQKIHARFIHIELKSDKKLPSNFFKIDKRNIFELAVPRIIEIFLLENGLI